MEVGDIDKRVVLLLGILVLGAASFLWYSKMYKPAVEERTAAAQALTTAQQTKASKEAELSAAKLTKEKQIDANRAPDAEARILLSRLGIAPTQDLDEMVIQIQDLQRKSGLRIIYDVDQSSSDTSTQADAAASIPGVTPVDITLKGSGPSYQSILTFITQLNDAVDSSRGKLYVRGRLLNLMSFTIGQMKDQEEGGDDTDMEHDPDKPYLLDGWVKFEFVIRAYTFDAGAIGTTDPNAGVDPNAPADGAGDSGAATNPDGSPVTPDAGGAAGAPTVDPATTTPATSTTPGAAV